MPEITNNQLDVMSSELEKMYETYGNSFGKIDRGEPANLQGRNISGWSQAWENLGERFSMLIEIVRSRSFDTKTRLCNRLIRQYKSLEDGLPVKDSKHILPENISREKAGEVVGKLSLLLDRCIGSSILNKKVDALAQDRFKRFHPTQVSITELIEVNRLSIAAEAEAREPEKPYQPRINLDDDN